MDRLGAIKYSIWEHHHIGLPSGDELMDQVLAFGFMVEQFFQALAQREAPRRKIVGHFHEWMGGTAIPELRRTQ
jgi:glycogen(starch) synthase